MRLHDFLDYRAREEGEAQFAIHADRHITYRAAQAVVIRLANALIDSGLQPGDRLAILSKNSIEYMLLYFASSKAGLVTIPLNYRLAPAEWGYILNDAEAKVLFTASNYLQDVEAIRGDLKFVERFVAIDGSLAGWEEYQSLTTDQPETHPTREVS